MEKIPTARTFLQNLIEENNQDSNIDIEDALIEFAKLHVEACKRDIIDNVKTCIGGDGSPLFSVTSVLNSYPLDNIK